MKLIFVLDFTQRRYIIKFATDGAVLTKTKSAVQGTIKIIPATVHGQVVDYKLVPYQLHKEITLFYYIGKYKKYLQLLESY